MEVDVAWDVFHSDPPFVDVGVYQLWLAGVDVDAANLGRCKFDKSLTSTFTLRGCDSKKAMELIRQDTRNHWAWFNQLVPFLQRPKLLINHTCFQLSAPVRTMLVQKYYEFDSDVVREFIGKKLTASVRKDLDDVSERTSVSLVSCRRQFDNLKRVMKVALGEPDPTDPELFDASRTVYEVIASDFLLPEDLSRSYVHMIFLCHYKIDVHKKRLHFLTYENLDYLTGLILQQWALPNSVQLDPMFVDMMRDLKSVMLSDRDILDEFKQRIAGHFSDSSSQLGDMQPQVWQRLDKNFHTLMRSLLTIGAGLSQANEIRDLFLDITDKVVSECTKMEMSQAHIVHVFMLLVYEFNQLKTVNPRYLQKYATQWKRYLNGIQAFLLNVYQTGQSGGQAQSVPASPKVSSASRRLSGGGDRLESLVRL